MNSLCLSTLCTFFVLSHGNTDSVEDKTLGLQTDVELTASYHLRSHWFLKGRTINFQCTATIVNDSVVTWALATHFGLSVWTIDPTGHIDADNLTETGGVYISVSDVENSYTWTTVISNLSVQATDHLHDAKVICFSYRASRDDVTEAKKTDRIDEQTATRRIRLFSNRNMAKLKVLKPKLQVPKRGLSADLPTLTSRKIIPPFRNLDLLRTEFTCSAHVQYESALTWVLRGVKNNTRQLVLCATKDGNIAEVFTRDARIKYNATAALEEKKSTETDDRPPRLVSKLTLHMKTVPSPAILFCYAYDATREDSTHCHHRCVQKMLNVNDAKVSKMNIPHWSVIPILVIAFAFSYMTMFKLTRHGGTTDLPALVKQSKSLEKGEDGEDEEEDDESSDEHSEISAVSSHVKKTMSSSASVAEHKRQQE